MTLYTLPTIRVYKGFSKQYFDRATPHDQSAISASDKSDKAKHHVKCVPVACHDDYVLNVTTKSNYSKSR